MKYSSIFHWFRKKPTVNKEEKPLPKKVEPTFEVVVENEAIEKKENNNQKKKEAPYIEQSTTIPTPISPSFEEIAPQKKKEEGKEILDDRMPSKEEVQNDRATLIKPIKQERKEPVLEPVLPPFNKGLPNQNELEEKENEIETELKKDVPSKDYIIHSNTLDELEKMLKKNYYEIKEMDYELSILEQKEEDEITLKEIDHILEELNILLRKLEQIKKEFYQKNYEEIHKFTSNDGYIKQLIEEYKQNLYEQDTKSSSILKVKQIEEYIDMINDIIDIENRKEQVEDKLIHKKGTLEIKEDEFDKLKEDYTDIEKMNQSIDYFSIEQDRMIANIDSKVNASETITKTAEYKTDLVINYTRLLASTLLFASAGIIPPTRKGNFLKVGLIAASVATLASSIRTRTKESKVTTKISFTDYSREITNGIRNVEEMNLMIDKTKLDIKFLKKEFEKEFSEYASIMPEYATMISKLDSIEKDLAVRSQLAKEYDKKLKDTYHKNNVKVKKLEEEYFN